MDAKDTVLNFDIASGHPVYATFHQKCRAEMLRHAINEGWPYVGDPVASHPAESAVTEDESVVLFELDEAIVLARAGFGRIEVTAASSSPKLARSALEEMREMLPRDDGLDPQQIPMVFWAYGQHGPMQINRELEAESWKAIRGNYPESTGAELARLNSEDFEPGKGGQLILWHGEPGTGKTTALRALAQSWRDWARFHYITDPEQFFGRHADYMLSVMLQKDDVVRLSPNGGPPQPVPEPWRVLILEDSGELLQADAKATQGQALSRFLNAVDGLIGQGLRVLTLVTTNEELGSHHPAVTRHGRALAEIEFTKFEPEAAAEWLKAHGATPSTAVPCLLADMYAKLEGYEHRKEQASVGFA